MPVFGIDKVDGTPVLFKMFSPTVVATEISVGALAYSVTSNQITHNASKDSVMSNRGDVEGAGYFGETLSATFELIPKTISATPTRAAAAVSCILPPLGATLEITGHDVFRVGSWADAINTNTGTAPNTHRWIYEGGGSISGSATGDYKMSLPLIRYRSISGLVSAVAV
jgi:hypothetical protein